MDRVVKIIKFALTYVGAFGVGIYFCAFICFGLDLVYVIGIFTTILLSVVSGISLIEDIKYDNIETEGH